MDGTIDTQLACSRDGIRWQRVGARETFLPLGDDPDGWLGGMAPEWISERYGRRCSIQGGIDKRALTRGKTEIDEEVMRKVPVLLERGGFIPGVDHGTPSDVPFENFRYLVDLLRELGRSVRQGD